MESFWSSLDHPWQACLEEAWSAYCAGSLPIGAVVVDAGGEILARGRNRWYENETADNQISGTRLAHAEINALIRLPQDRADYRTWALYTTLEPCPLCIGALYMAGVRNLHYAASDPWAGSTNLLGKTLYFSRKAISVSGPHREDLEAILIAISVESFLREQVTRIEEVLAANEAYFPAGVRLGEVLYQDAILTQLKAEGSTTAQVFNHMAGLWWNHEKAKL